MVSLYFYDKKIKLPECTRLGNFNYKIFDAAAALKKTLFHLRFWYTIYMSIHRHTAFPFL